MTYSLTWMPEVLIAAGLKVAEVPGWRTRGRGDVGKIQAVLVHHTVGSPKGNMPSLGVITNGRSDLPGPLCQLGLGRDGTFYVVAAGRANHAGKGNWQGVVNGNSQTIGIEAENMGTKADPWPEVQMDALRHGCAALLKYLRLNSLMVSGHKEYALPQGRKIDPLFDMSRFRLDVGAIMGGAAPAPTIVPAKDEEGRPTLMRGSRGPLVALVQEKIGMPAPHDGKFGPNTEAKVREFQRKHPPLVPDGRVGPKTWATLDTVS